MQRSHDLVLITGSSFNTAGYSEINFPAIFNYNHRNETYALLSFASQDGNMKLTLYQSAITGFIFVLEVSCSFRDY